MIKEQVLDERAQKAHSLTIAKVLITLSIYFICAATLLEHFSPIITLKTLELNL